MNEARYANKDEGRQSIENHASLDGSKSRMGFGRKFGLFGCGFVLLGLLIAAVVLFLTGIYVPFKGTEGVGP